jgi:hypothetical protein
MDRVIIPDDMAARQDLFYLMNEGIETLSKDADLDVRKIPTRMNTAGVKVREAQMEEDLSWLKIRTEDPKEMTLVCLRACRRSMDITQTNGLKFNKFSESIDQLARFVRTSNLAKEGSHTFAATSGSRIMDMNMIHSAKAQFPTPKETKVIMINRFGRRSSRNRRPGNNLRWSVDSVVHGILLSYNDLPQIASTSMRIVISF